MKAQILVPDYFKAGIDWRGQQMWGVTWTVVGTAEGDSPAEQIADAKRQGFFRPVLTSTFPQVER